MKITLHIEVGGTQSRSHVRRHVTESWDEWDPGTPVAGSGGKFDDEFELEDGHYWGVMIYGHPAAKWKGSVQYGSAEPVAIAGEFERGVYWSGFTRPHPSDAGGGE